jgi:SNF2 family DNA or RNA helicase
MGLGKTIESIAILALVESLKTPQEVKNRRMHHIVIVPKVTLGNWVRELRTWVPTIRVFKFYGGAAEKE